MWQEVWTTLRLPCRHRFISSPLSIAGCLIPEPKGKEVEQTGARTNVEYGPCQALRQGGLRLAWWRNFCPRYYRDTVLDPGAQREGARVSKHFSNQIVSVRIDRAATQRDTFAKPVDVGGSTPFC